MEKHDLVLNLHGEVPYPSQKCSLEGAFLPTLKDLHERFPKLRIVLEYCSTIAALDAVRNCARRLQVCSTIINIWPLASDGGLNC